MAKTYTKLPLSFDAQLNLLASRGLTIDDRARQEKLLMVWSNLIVDLVENLAIISP